MKKYFVKTFWCSMNYADSEKINMILLQSGFIKAKDEFSADLIIFNTCSVRKKWEDRVFGMIREVVRQNKNNPIIGITGCMVRKTGLNKKYLQEDNERNKAKKIELITNVSAIFNNDDKLFPRIKDLDFTFRIEEIKYIPFILTEITWEKIGSDDKFDDYLKLKQLRENPSSVQIIIQTWCDNYCTFCIVPYTRWKEISRNPSEILEEIKIAVKSWAKEVNLIGQNVNSYWKNLKKNNWDEESSKWIKTEPGLGTSLGSDFTSPFRVLLEEINKISWIDRIRFTSSNPHDMTSDILSSHFQLNKTCNYLHFALQSWSNELLKKMNRKHTYDDFKSQVEYLRKKDPLFSISTDIIVWFSWETEEMFQKTVKAFRELEFDFVFIARYSVRQGTIASKLYPDDVSNEIKAKRWHILNDILLENITKRNKLMLWREEEILIAWEKDSQFYWRTRNFKEVFFDKKEGVKIWDIVKVKIEELDKYVLKWSLVS